MKNLSLWEIFLLLIFAVLFFTLNFFTPLLHDDFAYLYKFGPKAHVRPTAVPILNLSDVFESQYYHYLDVNGRFFSHFLIQLVLLFGKSIFNILNTLVFLSLIFFTYQYSRNSQVGFKNKYILFFIICSIWFLSPFIGQTMFWVTGGINYLWSSFFVVLFLFLFKRSEQTNDSPGYIKLLTMFVCSFLIAGTNESVTFGVAAAFCVYAIFNFKKLNSEQWVMGIGFTLGVLGIIFSPGTFNRANNEIVIFPSIEILLKQKVIELVGIFYILKYPIMVSLFFLTFLKLNKVNIKRIIFREKLILLSVLFNCILFLIIGHLEERIFFGVSVFIMLLNALLLAETLKFLSVSKLLLISILPFCFLVYSFYNALSQVNDYRKKTIIFTNQLKNKTHKVFYFPEFKDSPFAYHTISGISDSKNYHNRVRSFHYGLSELNIIPGSLYHEIYNNSILLNKNNWSDTWGKKIFLLEKENFAIIALPPKFQYKEGLAAALVFSNGEEKKISISVIPITENYYAFLNTDTKIFDNVLSIRLINSSGETVQKIDKAVYK